MKPNKQREEDRLRELTRDLKVRDSQMALLQAATETADAANHVTYRLKQRLEDTVKQLESTVRILNDGLIISDLSGNIQAMNPAAEAIFNISDQDARSKFVGELISDFAEQANEQTIWTFLERIDATESDIYGLRDGLPFLVDINHTRLDRLDGSTIVLMVIRDLSPSEEANRTIKSYRSAFESSFDGILIVVDDKIVAANPAVSKFFGYNVDELLSKPLDDLFISQNHPIIDEAQEIGGVNLKLEGIHQTGARIETMFTASPITWDNKKGSLVTIKDMAELNPTPKFNGPRMICCFGSDFVITFANMAFSKYYGITKSKLIGMDIRSLMNSNETDPFLLNIKSLSPSEPFRRMQLHAARPDGVISLQEWTDYATFDEHGVEYQRVGKDLTNTVTSTDIV